jgi:hypothetical protein
VPDAVQDPGYPWVDIIAGIVFAAILIADLFGVWVSKSGADAHGTEPKT